MSSQRMRSLEHRPVTNRAHDCPGPYMVFCTISSSSSSSSTRTFFLGMISGWHQLLASTPARVCLPSSCGVSGLQNLPGSSYGWNSCSGEHLYSSSGITEYVTSQSMPLVKLPGKSSRLQPKLVCSYRCRSILMKKQSFVCAILERM